MKVIVKENNKQSENEFPRLMISSTNGNVVLFHKDSCGTVMISKTDEVGYYCTFWDMDMFKPFTGTVELSND